MPVLTEKYTIRKARDNEIPVILELIHATIRKCYPEVYPDSVTEYFLEYHNLENTKKNARTGTTLVMLIGNKIVATGNVKGNLLGALYVHNDYQRQGIGRIMMEAMIDVARQNKVSTVILDSTLIAKRLYDNMGFLTLEYTFELMSNGEELYYFKMAKNI